MIDWNNDGKLDLLVGYNGYIWLHLNNGTLLDPTYNVGVKLKASDNNVIYSGDTASFFTLADMNGDGVKDLVLSDTSDRINCVCIRTWRAVSLPHQTMRLIT